MPSTNKGMQQLQDLLTELKSTGYFSALQFPDAASTNSLLIYNGQTPMKLLPDRFLDGRSAGEEIGSMMFNSKPLIVPGSGEGDNYQIVMLWWKTEAVEIYMTAIIGTQEEENEGEDAEEQCFIYAIGDSSAALLNALPSIVPLIKQGILPTANAEFNENDQPDGDNDDDNNNQ